MKTKIFLIIIALLVITAYGCSNDQSSQPPSSDESVSESTHDHQSHENTLSPVTPVIEQPIPKAQANCTAIMDTHCTSCHHTTRICQKLGRKNMKGWLRTIKNMISHGAQLTPVEIETLAQCLNNQDQEIIDYCKSEH